MHSSHADINTLRPKQNWGQFAEDISKCITSNMNVWNSIQISSKYIYMGLTHSKSTSGFPQKSQKKVPWFFHDFWRFFKVPWLSMTFPKNFIFPGFPGFPDPVGTLNIGSGNVGGIDQYNIPKPTFTLVQEKRNSIANALELRLSCTNPSICMHH